MFLKGFIYLISGQIIFVICGFGINFGLARLLGPELYGAYGVIISILLWAELFVMHGIPIALQKFLAEQSSIAYMVKKVAIKIQFVFSGLVAIALFFGSSFLADFFNDPKYELYLKIVSSDILIFGLYRFYLSFNNGLRKFKNQAIIVSCYAVGKLSATFLLVFLKFSLIGAFLGSITGSVIGLITGILLSGIERNRTNFDFKRFIDFSVPNILYAVSVNLLFYIDLWSVRYFLDEVSSGFYNAACTIARMPTFMFYALSGVMLPLISRAIFNKETHATRQYIEQSVRIMFIFYIPCTLIVISTSNNLISLLFTDMYSPSAEILNILIVGLAFLTIFTLLNNIIIADNKMKLLFGITIILVIVDFLLNWKLVPLYGTKGAAYATSITSLIGVVIIGAIIYFRFRVLIKIKSLLRFSIAGLVVFYISGLYEFNGILLIFNYIALCGLYVLILYLFKEFTAEDIEKLKTYFIKR